MNAQTPIDADAAFRASVVGASEVAALFGCSPWLTHYELWMRKAGRIPVEAFNPRGPDGTPVNSRIHWGVKLEKLIIEEACERWGYEPLETPQRVDNGAGLGGHPDRLVWCPVRKCRVTLEVKTVDWLERKKWGDEPPLHYLLQPNTYAGLLQTPFADVIVMVLGGGTDLQRFQNEFRPKLYAETEARVAAFWQSIRANKPPKPEYARDRDVIGDVYASVGDTVVDMRFDNRMPELAAAYLAACEQEKAGREAKRAAEAEILHKLGDNTVALLDDFRVRVPVIAESPGTVITPEMVGQLINARAAHRRFYIKEIA